MAARRLDPVRTRLPLPTVITLGIFGAVLWLNAIVNHYRFNVAIAVLASVPVLIVVARSAFIARKSVSPGAAG